MRSAPRCLMPSAASAGVIPTWRAPSGVHNLNESAGGFAGLATLVWLAPLGWSARSRAAAGRVPRRPAVLRGDGGVRPSPGREPAPGRAGPERDRQPPAHALGGLRPGACSAGSGWIGWPRSRPRRVGAWLVGRRRAGGAGGLGRRRSASSPGSVPERKGITPKAAARTPGRRSGRLPRPRRAPGPANPGVLPALSRGVGRSPGRPGGAGRVLAARPDRRARGPPGADGPDDARPFRLRVRPQPGDRAPRRPPREPGHRLPAPGGRAGRPRRLASARNSRRIP